MLTSATLSVHNFVNSVGAYVGFASIIAVAILILLYFAHARETATLRDRLDESQARIGGLEARVAQLMSAQAAAQAAAKTGRTPAPVVPAPALRPAGAAAVGAAGALHAAGFGTATGGGSVRRVPVTATGTATQVGVPAALAGAAAGSTLPPAAPAGTGAPPLASATKLIPDPVELPKPVLAAQAQTDGAPDDTLFVPASAVAAVTAAAAASAASRPQAVPAPVSSSEPKIEAAAPAADATQALPSVAAAAAPVASATARGVAAAPTVEGASAEAAPPAAGSAAVQTEPSAPPRVQIGAEPRTANGGARRTNPRTRPAEPLLPPMDPDGTKAHRRFSGRLLPLLISGIAVAVIVVGLIVITNNGGSTTADVSHKSNPTGASVSNHQHRSAPFKASKYTVAVLNGTAVAGLAGDVATKLGGDGFKKGNATNAASQTYGTTVVYYVPGAHAADNRIAATHVAKALAQGGGTPAVKPAAQVAIKSCSISAAGASLGSCSADVIVLVGSDRAGLASSGSGG